MNEMKTAINSGLHHVKFTDDMKKNVLEEGRKSEKRKEHGSGRFFGRYAVPVAVCLVLCIGTTAAAKILLWDKYVAEKYKVDSDEQLQEETIESGLADQQIGAVAEDNGIRIEVMQTVATNSHMDVYLKIQAENEEVAKLLADANPNYEISYDNSMEGSGGAGMENYYTGEGMKTVMTEGDKEEGPEYEIYNIYSDIIPNKANLNGDTVHLKIHNFLGNSQTSPDKVVEGDWELSWTIQASEEEKVVTLDKEYTLYGKQFKVNKIKLSSTSVSVYLDRELIDEQGLMGEEQQHLGAQVYAIRSEEHAQNNDRIMPDEKFEFIEWRGPWGIPLETYKNMTSKDIENAYEQIEAGTYQGEYIDFLDWNKDKQHVIIDQWYLSVQLKDGTDFEPENSTGSTTDTENEYIMTTNYVGYLDVDNVSAIYFGDCVIPIY